MEPNTLFKRYHELKNKLREDLKAEVRGISGAGDASGAGDDKIPRKNTLTKGETKPRPVDTTDYFELVYECIDTRIHFLNIVSLNSRSPVEPDIDLAILQALLNGKEKYTYDFSLLKENSFYSYFG
jgi:hypothetical protein